jgi:hypothetical protein
MTTDLLRQVVEWFDTGTVTWTSTAVGVASGLFAVWEERRKRAGVYGRPERGDDALNAQPGRRRFEIDIQNFREYATGGPIYAVVSCVGPGQEHSEPIRGEGIYEVLVAAGPYFQTLRFSHDEDYGRFILAIPEIAPFRTIGVNVQCGASAIRVELHGDEPKSGRELGRVRLPRAASRWPDPIVIGTEPVTSNSRYYVSPSWWLYSLLLAGGLSIYAFILATFYARKTLSIDELVDMIEGDIGYCSFLLLCSSLVFSHLRRRTMPVARGYQDKILVFRRG